jgi:hypothetical protein
LGQLVPFSANVTYLLSVGYSHDLHYAVGAQPFGHDEIFVQVYIDDVLFAQEVIPYTAGDYRATFTILSNVPQTAHVAVGVYSQWAAWLGTFTLRDISIEPIGSIDA